MAQTVIYRGFGNKYSKEKQVCNPFWLVSLLGTKFLGEPSLVKQKNSATQNRAFSCK